MVSRPAAAPPADLPGQTNDQQRDGAGEDEESRADDAAAQPHGGEMSDPVDSTEHAAVPSGVFVVVTCCVTALQKEEGKKSAGPKLSRNHQQRLESIVKQTTVETRVRNTNILWVLFITLPVYLREMSGLLWLAAVTSCR